MSNQRPAEEDFEDLYETAPCGYLSLSPDAHIVRLNGTLAGWLGCAPDSLIGTSFHDILTFGGRIAFETHLAPLLRLQGFVNELAFDLRQPDGSTVPIIANAAEKRDATGRHVLTRITLFKALERRRYERTLVDARTKAETAKGIEAETAALREQFIAVLGHDLRNPLAAIAAGMRLLEKADHRANVAAGFSANWKRASRELTPLLPISWTSPEDGLAAACPLFVMLRSRWSRYWNKSCPKSEQSHRIEILSPTSKFQSPSIVIVGASLSLHRTYWLMQ